MKIGIFDSGHGGRFTLEKCKVLLPNIEFVGYFDHANAPYGDKSQAQILQLTERGIQALLAQNCDLVLIACNTACTQALRRLQEKHAPLKILGCLIPAIETAIDTQALSIGLIGTRRTIESKKYEREAFKINPRAKIHSVATPDLVPWIEAQAHESTACQAYLKQHIDALIETHKIETLILGCTHYSALKPSLKKLYPRLSIIDSAKAQAQKLQPYLERHAYLQ